MEATWATASKEQCSLIVCKLVCIFSREKKIGSNKEDRLHNKASLTHLNV